MSEPDVNPYVGVVVDLVDPYFTPGTKNIGGFKATSAASNYAIWWVRNHPGRWAMVAEGSAGLTRALLKVCPDIQVTEHQPKGSILRVFARVDHPESEPLAQALARRRIGEPRLYLPEVTRDEFNWSPEELAEACRIARDNLFPVSS
jgi:hypothetical protein